MAADTSPQSATSPSTSAPPLLAQLPAELRNRIYRLVLLAPDKIDITPSGLKNRTALLQTCQQIHQEAVGIFFSETAFKFTFVLGATNLLATWMDAIGEESIRLLKDVVMDVNLPLEQWNQHMTRFHHVLHSGQDDPEDLKETWGILKVQTFGVHVVAMVESIKAKPIDPAYIRMGEGVGQHEATRRIASALCDMLQQLLHAEARSREELIAALPYGEKALDVFRS